MARSRIRFRPPGLKPWTKIGTLGPFRGRLGLQWVIAPIVLGAILVVVGWAFLTRANGPQAPFLRVVSVADVRDGSYGDEPAVKVTIQGKPFVVRFDADQLQVVAYPTGGCYPWTVYQGQVYVDPTKPAPCGASPIP